LGSVTRVRKTADSVTRHDDDETGPIVSRPLYLDIADTLQEEIARGMHEVGDKLPTELELCQRFDVSRSVVRQALGEMESVGLVQRRQGSGTTLVARQPALRYVLAIGSEPDILRYASETMFEITEGRRPVAVADGRRLGLGDPSGWSQWRGLRRSGRNGLPLGFSTVYIPNMYADVMGALGKYYRRALFDVIAERHSITITAIDQTISATMLDPEEAEVLQSKTGMPALAIARRFSSVDGLFEVAESVHPADRFSYELRLERESAARTVR
jgi:DNA-binding GntR family transcriptional regulator